MTQPAVHHPRPHYLRIFAVLAVLTAVEVGVSFTPLDKRVQVPILLALALAKATLVVLYYMHLRYEGPVLRIIGVAPLLFAINLTLLPLFDLALRR